MAKFAFISSVRFWQLGFVALVEFLGAQGVLPADLAHALALWIGGAAVIRTVDRYSEQ